MKCSMVAIAVLALAALTTTACGGDDDMGNADCAGDVPTFQEVPLFTKCTMCHDSRKTGSARIGAPPGIDFDHEAAALDSARKSRKA